MKSKLLYLILLLVVSSCSNQPVDMWSGEPDYKLGLSEISLSQKENAEFLSNLALAKKLFRQYEYWAEIDSLYTSDSLDTNDFVLFLSDSKEPTFVFGKENEGFKINSIATKKESWSVKHFEKPIQVKAITEQYQRLIQAWQGVDSMDTLNLIPLVLTQSKSIYFSRLGSKSTGVLGGGKEFIFKSEINSLSKNEIKTFGDPSDFNKLEVRHFNFQVANGNSKVPAVLDFLDVLKYQSYFPSHYLHTGKYIFGFVSIKGRPKTWKVLDPSDDDRYKILPKENSSFNE